MTTDPYSHLVTLEGMVAQGQRAQVERDHLLRAMIDSGMKQADAWRAWNEARARHNLPPVTRAAVEAVVRRTQPTTV